MKIALSEDDLCIVLPAGAKGRKFDDEKDHRLSHCMKAVDFIVELEDRMLFVECKDPDHPKAAPGQLENFLSELFSDRIDQELKYKYRDSWLHEWAEGRINKPVFYLVLIGAECLSDVQLLTRSEALQRQLPLAGPTGLAWSAFAAGCMVMNVKSWNKHFPEMQVKRISAG